MQTFSLLVSYYKTENRTYYLSRTKCVCSHVALHVVLSEIQLSVLLFKMQNMIGEHNYIIDEHKVQDSCKTGRLFITQHL